MKKSWIITIVVAVCVAVTAGTIAVIVKNGKSTAIIDPPASSSTAEAGQTQNTAPSKTDGILQKTVSLFSISVSSNPAKTSYYVGDTLNTSGLKITLLLPLR